MTDGAGQTPFVYHRQIHWGETDSGGIVYTGQFLDFMMEAAEMWWREIIGCDWHQIKVDHKMGSPMVHASLDFIKPAYDGEILGIKVMVEKLGASSITHVFEGYGPDGVLRFTGKLVGAVITLEPFKAVRVPDDWRKSIQNYITACDKADLSNT
jgi:YbgC/YbaW family acyl-CoA thioester hydrolase